MILVSVNRIRSGSNTTKASSTVVVSIITKKRSHLIYLLHSHSGSLIKFRFKFLRVPWTIPDLISSILLWYKFIPKFLGIDQEILRLANYLNYTTLMYKTGTVDCRDNFILYMAGLGINAYIRWNCVFLYRRIKIASRTSVQDHRGGEKVVHEWRL